MLYKKLPIHTYKAIT